MENYGYTAHEIELIKEMLDFKPTEKQLSKLLYMSRESNLNPIRRQIYAMMRGGKMSVETGIDGFRIIAERTGKYTPGRPTEFVFDDKGNLLSATSYVKKLGANGQWHESGETSFFKEYDTGRNVWKFKPSVMLAKVSESRAIRRAFPDAFSGLYITEEMEMLGNDSDPKNSPTQVKPKKASEPTISDKDVENLKSCLEQYGIDESFILLACGVSKLEDIKESQKEICNSSIRKKKHILKDKEA